MKRILLLTFALLLCIPLLFTPAAAAEGPTKAELQEKWQSITTASTIFQTQPSITAPYAVGALTDDFLESGITYLNFVRFTAGLPEVELDDTLNTDSQYGAVCLAAIDTLTHYPTKPSDMDDDFFERASTATSSANISARWGYNPLSALQSAVSGCMNDNSSLTNLSTVGHRRWLLNPTLGKVGFGYARSAGDWDYIVNHVHDRTGTGCDYDFISWPVAGNHPTDLFDVKNPWSITLNPDRYRTPSADAVAITITRESDGTTWHFDSATGTPESHSKAYMTVNTQWYGIPNCIIFHPGSANVDGYAGVFTVEVTGLYTKSGTEASLHYQVDFFDIDECFHSYTAAVTEPTCTEQGYTTHTCTRCGDSYVDSYTAALGHSYGTWYTTQEPTCTAAGSRQRDCSRCDDHEIGTLPALGHAYESTVTDPTCTEQGFTTHTCTRCSSSHTDGYTAALGHSYGDWYTTQEPTCTAAGTQRRDCVRCDSCETNTLAALGHNYETTVTDPTCTEQGYTTHTCARCGSSHSDTFLPALGHDWDVGVIITEPTEEAHGLRRHTCLRCAATEDRIIPALSHTHSYETAVTAPTCTEQGYATHTCDCGDRYVDSYTAALGHDWKGLECTRCSAVRENPFTDTDPLGFYFEPVLWAVDKGITTGATPTTFNPLGQCQRAQVVTFLWRAAGQPEPTSTHNPFVDVKKTDFFHKAVLWAVENGITNGLDTTHFGPYAYCNRAQVVTFLWRSVDQPAASARNPFTDVKAGEFYYDAVLWAVEKGITNGLSSTEFGINAVCNRAQIVTFLYRTFA